MFFKCIPTGMFDSNSYIIGDNGEGVLIDCGVASNEILKEINDSLLKIKYIILTHGHIDHICSCSEVRNVTNAKLIIHESEKDAFANPLYNLSFLIGKSFGTCEVDKTVQDGDVIEVGGLRYEIIHTPGHSPGSICLKVDNKLFTGDTLFKSGIGRTDLNGGNSREIEGSIKNKLYVLNDDVEVYPGHGMSSTIGYEKKYNQFVRV